MTTLPLTGGCQCGAIRYAVHAEPTNPHICHCRMCQKAVGSIFAPYTGVRRDDFKLTRGSLQTFMSSPVSERGFCSRCGTPLTFRYLDVDRISFTIGSLDEPERVKPAAQYSVESRVSWFHELAGLPDNRTEDLIPPDWLARIKSRQHPDHDTDDWNPPEQPE